MQAHTCAAGLFDLGVHTGFNFSSLLKTQMRKGNKL